MGLGFSMRESYHLHSVHQRSLLALGLWLRPILILASRVLPSTPPLFQRVERHFLLGRFGGFSVSGIHLCPHTSQTATRILVQPMAAII